MLHMFAVLVGWDFRQAFPLLAQAFLLLVMQLYLLPEHFITLITALYKDNYHFLMA